MADCQRIAVEKISVFSALFEQHMPKLISLLPKPATLQELEDIDVIISEQTALAEHWMRDEHTFLTNRPLLQSFDADHHLVRSQGQNQAELVPITESPMYPTAKCDVSKDKGTPNLQGSPDCAIHAGAYLEDSADMTIEQLKNQVKQLQDEIGAVWAAHALEQQSSLSTVHAIQDQMRREVGKFSLMLKP